MRAHFILWPLPLLIGSLVGLGLHHTRTSADDSPLAPYYGFRPLESFKLSQRSANLLTADLNHDGLNDLLLVDNGHSRLDLLIQRASATETDVKKVGATDVNVVSNHWRFEHRKLPIDQEVSAVALGDFNGDGRTDIVYFGSPDQLVIRFQPAQGEWTEKKHKRIPDAAPSPWFLAAGDLDGNGLDDVVILGKFETIILYQTTKGVLDEPRKLMNTSDKLSLAQIADLDGDGRNDLCYLAGEGLTRTLGARLQSNDGQLGPEYMFDLERSRAVAVRDVDGKPGQEIVTIDSRTGRLKLLHVERQTPGENALPERLIQFGFGKQGTGRDRDLTTADFDGDGLIDLAVTDPDASRILLFRQRLKSGLDLGTPFPGLSGSDQIRAADFAGHGTAEIVVRSGPEKTLGISRYIDGRLTFPESIPLESEASCIALADLDNDLRPEIVVLAKTKKDRSSEYSLQALKRTDTHDFSPVSFGGQPAISLDLKGTPERLLQGDITGDRRDELFVFQGTSKATQIYGIDERGIPTEIGVFGNMGLGSAPPGAISFATLRGKKGVLVAQDNVARFMVLGDTKRWQVVEQFHTGESNSKIVGVTAIDLDGLPNLEIALVDTGVKKLRILRQNGENYSQWKEIDIGDFPYKSLKVGDFNGDKHDDLLLFGADKFAVLYAGAASPTLHELASFESQLEKTYPTDVVAGDLNHDGEIDLVLTDTRNHFVEILQYRPDSGLKHALYFRVFEQKTFRNDEEAGDSEPREALIADVTGDGLPDLLLLIHDRLLLYPQDEGPTDPQ